MKNRLPAKSLVGTISAIIVLVIALSMVGLCNVNAQNQLSVSFHVSNESEYTIVAGTVTDPANNPVEGAAVSIQAVDSSGKAVHFELVYSDSNGAFTDKFKTPEGVSGEGNVFVSAGKPGYDNGTAQSAFTAVPEFPTAVAAAVVSISIAMLILRRRSSK
jgi:hypothetical protein